LFLGGEKKTVKPKVVSVPDMPEFTSKDPLNRLENDSVEVKQN
jgi:hypothetical protein